ncbi:methyltransferase-like protein 27 isoform X1 [Scophthalmus maximus]|uniref:methyltransferase-like protein 27 isoform X1 n=2 Tax=Scophthalmus maximus TaxID=52904 RepID=UPI001FA89A13|nr:methyltransferase-like protein 27 isoform X1 [Scophthalmus maximus]XP_047190928.1 methyltransferase-like protein 27 isoform X1 [Scophthalmus maximus]XP_047190929.1 methyltransferase-like protein 27 isoform X1 [Scophthalmus maximus]XP_047190930.1 methyltransferase-like protein 27 isoform X1 [Scophthalmus maximus]XP_047190931.1 methyltransferase-like protein 27 isoform X1 [Scophthalmus maximus]XP_047190932.1 methyltransferase-like protein 27 isoform X1 [Scophthalmus maximus]XP_047190933.1 me
MSDSSRTMEDMRVVLQTCKSPCAKDRVKFYDTWAETYDKDVSLMSYRAPHLAVNFLSENFTGTPEESLVLDVACGSGLVAKLMVELGFRRFVGVDGSKGMLDQAAESGLYQDLNQALLGSDPLPAQPGAFDVVMIIGALRPGFVPVSVIKEIYQAAKPGAYICMSRVDPRSEAGDEYKVSMEQELQLMEDEGLWTLVATKEMHRYMLNFYQNYNEGEQNEHYLNGTMYLYRKAHNES